MLLKQLDLRVDQKALSGKIFTETITVILRIQLEVSHSTN